MFRKLLEMVEREDNCVSLIRVMSLLGFIAVVIAVYVEAYCKITFPHLSEFITFEASIILFSVGNKAVELKSNLGLNLGGVHMGFTPSQGNPNLNNRPIGNSALFQNYNPNKNIRD